MAKDLIKKLINEAIATNGTYAEFIVTDDNIAFVCDGGKKKSTKNYKEDVKKIPEMERTLKTFDDKSLLFAGGLKRIFFRLRDGRESEFIKKADGNIITIVGNKVTESCKKEYRYACFSDEKDEQCGVAFEIKTTKSYDQIQACSGRILNGVFDSGISTDLRFVISGDFYGKSAVPDPLYKDNNDKAIGKVGAILEKAVGKMIHLGLLSMSLFSVLPCGMDEDSEINTGLIGAVRRAGKTYPLFRNRSEEKSYTTIRSVIMGTKEVTDLFPQKMIERLFDGIYWLEPCAEGSREEYCLQDMGVPYYDREKMLWELFTDDNMDELSDILVKQPDHWLRKFYIFCSEHIYHDKVKRRVVSALRNMKSIRDSKGKMRLPSEVSLILDEKKATNKSVVVKESILNPGGKEDEYTGQIIDFFYEDLGVGCFDLKPEMEQLAEDLMKKKQAIDKLYCERLVKLAKYDKDNPGEIDFEQYAIFPYESSGRIRRVRASELVIGVPYVSEGNKLANALKRKKLWKGFKKMLNTDDLKCLLDFAAGCGAVGKPVIRFQKAEKHPYFVKKLFADGSQGKRDSNYDYSIPGLEEIVRSKSVKLKELLWSAILEAHDPEGVLYAEYSVDNRKIVNREDSSLITILREKSWVPGKDGKLYAPANILIADISDDLKYDKHNPILKKLGFGSGLKNREKELADLSKKAEKEGYALVPKEEYEEYLKWKEAKGRRKK